MTGAGRRPGEKARLAAAVAASGRFPVEAIAATLGVPRSNLVEQLKCPACRRGPYQREGDNAPWPRSARPPMRGPHMAIAASPPC